jgi:very-short-patch-repair endonuclease
VTSVTLSPSPPAGEGLGRGVGGDSRQKTLAEVRDRRALMLARAKHMRSSPTEAEARLWSILRAKRLAELKWHQVVLDDRYIADFVCFERRLIVEADGGQHAERECDAERDAWFSAQGFSVLRFWNNDILSNTDSVAIAILNAVESSGAADAARPLAPTPLPQGERGLADGALHG